MERIRMDEGVTGNLPTLHRHSSRWLPAGPPSLWRVAAAILVLSTAAVLAAADNAAPKATGSASAHITMEIFSDYQCPGCKVLHFATLRRVVDEYVSTGKVYLIYRDLPLPQHTHARQAARYANAAQRLGKFEAVDDALYGTQETWSKNGQIEAQLASVLTKTELKKLQELARDPSVDAGIARDIQLARQQQVNQTPTLVITANGKVFRVAGVVQYEVLRRFLDSLLE